jgi:hypothetical protein
MIAEFNHKWEEDYKIKTLQRHFNQGLTSEALPVRRMSNRYATGTRLPILRRQGQMETETMRRASLRRARLNNYEDENGEG